MRLDRLTLRTLHHDHPETTPSALAEMKSWCQMVLGKQPVSLFAIPFGELHGDLLWLVGGFSDHHSEEQFGDFGLGAQLFGEAKMKIRLILRMKGNRRVIELQVVVI